MRVRAFLLTALLLGLAGAFQLWGARVGAGGRGLLREGVLIGLPIATGLLAWACFRRPPALAESRCTAADLRRLVPWLGGALLLELAVLPLGYLLGWLTFTVGDQELEARTVYTWLWALPLSILFATFATEWALRGRLWRAGVATGAAPLGWLLAVACGVALTLPVIMPGFVLADPGFVAAGCAVALAHEIAYTLLYRRCGLLAAGAARGSLLYLDAFLVADRFSLYLPAASYVASAPLFYLLRGLASWVALGVLAFGLARRPLGGGSTA